MHSTFILLLILTRFLKVCCSVANLGLTLYNPMNSSTPGFPVLHYLPEFSQTHVHWVSIDAIQSSHPLSPPSLFALSLAQHQRLFLKMKNIHYNPESLIRIKLPPVYVTKRIWLIALYSSSSRKVKNADSAWPTTYIYILAEICAYHNSSS